MSEATKPEGPRWSYEMCEGCPKSPCGRPWAEKPEPVPGALDPPKEDAEKPEPGMLENIDPTYFNPNMMTTDRPQWKAYTPRQVFNVIEAQRRDRERIAELEAERQNTKDAWQTLKDTLAAERREREVLVGQLDSARTERDRACEMVCPMVSRGTAGGE